MTQNNLKDRQGDENFDPMDDWVPTMDGPEMMPWEPEQWDDDEDSFPDDGEQSGP